MKIEIESPITADPKLSGSGLVAVMCRVVVDKGAVTLIIGDHVHYHAEAASSGTLRLVNKGPVPAKKKPKK